MLSGEAAALSPALTGVAMGLQFNPLVAAVTSAAAAALVGYRTAPASRRWWALAVLLAGWVVGDGIRVAGSAGAGTEGAVAAAAWIVAGLAVGYLLPALAGAAIGRAVFHGTGWLAAGTVALLLTPAIWALSERVSVSMWGAVR